MPQIRVLQGVTGAENSENLVDSPLPGMTVKEFADLASSIVVFILHRPQEGIRGPLADAMGAWARWGIATSTPEDQFGGEISATRGGLAREFMLLCRERPQFKFMVMIDNDEDVNPLAPIMLARWNEPFVTGVVCSPSEHGKIKACFTAKDAAGVARFPTIKYTGRLPSRGLREIWTAGAGLACIRIDAFEKVVAKGLIPFYIPDHIRRQCWETGTLKQGEDIAFCYQLEEVGLKRYVDFSVRAKHYKMSCYEWPSKLIDHTLDPEDWRIDPRDYNHEA